jgi:hypothetical protein
LDYINEIQRNLVNQTQFNIMIGGLEVQSALAANEPALPAVVAAAAEHPVEVEVTTQSGSRKFVSTVGRVYRNVPSANQHEMEQTLKLDHDYDHHTDTVHHKDFTVRGTPFEAARFRY